MWQLTSFSRYCKVVTYSFFAIMHGNSINSNMVCRIDKLCIFTIITVFKIISGGILRRWNVNESILMVQFLVLYKN